MSKAIPGQLSIFDVSNEPPRPCDYKFKRYIGQEVEVYISGHPPIRATITGIEPYYTELDVGYVGTPYNLSPYEELPKPFHKVDFTDDPFFDEEHIEKINNPQVKTCKDCDYWREVWSYDGDSEMWACFAYTICHSDDPNKAPCSKFKLRSDND